MIFCESFSSITAQSLTVTLDFSISEITRAPTSSVLSAVATRSRKAATSHCRIGSFCLRFLCCCALMRETPLWNATVAFEIKMRCHKVSGFKVFECCHSYQRSGDIGCSRDEPALRLEEERNNIRNATAHNMRNEHVMRVCFVVPVVQWWFMTECTDFTKLGDTDLPYFPTPDPLYVTVWVCARMCLLHVLMSVYVCSCLVF